MHLLTVNRSFSYSTKESGSSFIFIRIILYTRLDRMALELLSLLCTFENSSNISKRRSIQILFSGRTEVAGGTELSSAWWCQYAPRHNCFARSK